MQIMISLVSSDANFKVRIIKLCKKQKKEIIYLNKGYWKRKDVQQRTKLQLLIFTQNSCGKQARDKGRSIPWRTYRCSNYCKKKRRPESHYKGKESSELGSTDHFINILDF